MLQFQFVIYDSWLVQSSVSIPGGTTKQKNKRKVQFAECHEQVCESELELLFEVLLNFNTARKCVSTLSSGILISLHLDWVHEVMSGDSPSVYVSCFFSFLVCVSVRACVRFARVNLLEDYLLWVTQRHAVPRMSAVCCVLLTCWVSSYASPSGSSIPSPWPSMASCPYSSGCRRTERMRRSVWQRSLCMLTPPHPPPATLQLLGFLYTNVKYFCLSFIYFQHLNKWLWSSCVSKCKKTP